MAQTNEIHVRRDPDGRWRADGPAAPPGVFASRQLALQRAEETAQAEAPSRVILHREDGSIERQLDYDAEQPTKPAARHVGGVRSRVHIGGHPVHPMLVPLPIAMFLLAPLADIGFAISGDVFWARASYYLLLGGFATGALAGIVGAVDFATIKRAHTLRQGWYHLVANAGAMGLAFVNILARAGEVDARVVPEGIILSVVTAALIVVAEWFGGELAYRHKIGAE